MNFAIRNYVEHFLKKDFVESKPTIISNIFEEIKSWSPPPMMFLAMMIEIIQFKMKIAIFIIRIIYNTSIYKNLLSIYRVKD